MTSFMCFPDRGKNITMDMRFLGRITDNSWDMCFLEGEHISQRICVLDVQIVMIL